MIHLWRLVPSDRNALDGSGTAVHGSRYASPGRPLVHFASEAGLAVLIALRYLPDDDAALDAPMLLCRTQSAAVPERPASALDEAAVREQVDQWAAAGRSLLFAVSSAVLPEAEVIILNPAHAQAADLAPWVMRPFQFRECLHRPPMLARYRAGRG